jgi:hypothetical protein
VTTPTGGSAMAYYRRGGPPRPLEERSSMIPSAPAEPRARDTPERDELDRLFLGED